MLSEKNIVSVIRWGIFAALFVPLAVIPWLFFPFSTSRGFLFQIIVEILFALYLPLAIKNPAFRPQLRFNLNGSQRLNLIVCAVFLYFGTLLFSTLFGLDPYRSFFGNYERMWGFFQLSHFFVFFVILAGVFRTKEEWGVLLRAALIVGGLSAFAALAQFTWILITTGETIRAGGLVGNPAFLSAYLFFTIFFSFIFVAEARRDPTSGSLEVRSRPRLNPGSTLPYFVFSAFALVAVLISGTRGAFVGCAAAAVTGAVLLLVFSRRRLVRAAAALCVGAVVAGAFLLIQYGSLFEKPKHISESTFYSLGYFDAPPAQTSQFGFLSRLTDFSIYDTTTLTRLATWKTVLASAKDYPVFGVGPENFTLAFNKYFNAEFYTAERSEIWFDRAHNAYIDALVMEGWVGFAAYLFLYVACFFVIFRLYQRSVLTPLAALAFALFFAAYGTQNFFLFDSFSAFLMFIFAVAYLNSRLEFQREKEERKKLPPLLPARIFLIPLAAVAALLWAFTARPMAESYLLAKAESGVYGIDKSMALFDQALSWHTFGDNEVRSRLALAAAKAVQNTETETLPPSLSGYLDAAFAALGQNIQESDKYHLLYRLQLSDVYNLKLSRIKTTSEEIERILKESVAISPGRMEFEFALAQTEFLKNNFTEAIRLLEEASAKNPDHSMPYWKIAQNYHFMGDDEKAIPYFEKAMYLGASVKKWQELLWPEEYYVRHGDYAKVVFTDLTLLKKVPADNKKKVVELHMNLALAYQALGMNDKAREHALKVGELDPSRQEAVGNFLKELE